MVKLTFFIKTTRVLKSAGFDMSIPTAFIKVAPAFIPVTAKPIFKSLSLRENAADSEITLGKANCRFI